MTDEALDFTLVAVAERSTAGVPRTDRGWLPLNPDSGKALVGEPVNIIQHPGGDPQQIVIKNNRVTNIVDEFLHYVADTEPGSSGAPVLNMQWELAALHHSGVPKRDGQDRIVLRDGSPWDGSRFTAHRIAWEANEGVRISSIVRFIQKLLGNEHGPARELFEEAISGAPQTTAMPAALASARIPTAASFPQPIEQDDEYLDRLTPEEIAEIVAELDEQSFEVTHEITRGIRLEEAAPGDVLVAQGDSWFDYSPAGLDIIDCLKKFYGYRIHNVSDAGDTLDNMAWGTEYDGNWHRKPPPLDETLDAVRKYRPRAVLLSGGGNDIAGDELLSFLNHKKTGLPPLRQPYTGFVIGTYFRKAYEEILRRIWEIDDRIHIITHGYGYGVPDGRAVFRLFGFSFVGPWLRPALTSKGYIRMSEREEITHALIDMINNMLRDLANDDVRRRIHYIDLRGVIRDGDWENELHLRNSAFKRIAGKFDEVLRRIPA